MPCVVPNTLLGRPNMELSCRPESESLSPVHSDKFGSIHPTRWRTTPTICYPASFSSFCMHIDSHCGRAAIGFVFQLHSLVDSSSLIHVP
jgi:hypothetical protein